MTPIDAALDWAVASGPPNWVFVLALLTSPARWSSATVAIVRSRLLDVDDRPDRAGRRDDHAGDTGGTEQ